MKELLAITRNNSVYRFKDKVFKECRRDIDCIREISLLRAIDHPLIVTLLSFEIEKEKIILTLPYLEPIPENISIEKFYSQCLEILLILEKMKIVHLDFRTENMRYRNDKIILIDFGHALLLNEYNLISKDRYPPRYIRAPEFSDEHITLVDTRADVWSLGILCHYHIYKVYPWHLTKLDKKDSPIEKDISLMLSVNRPLASELAKDMKLEIGDVKLNLPIRQRKVIDDEILFSNMNDFDPLEIRTQKNFILKAMETTNKFDEVLALFAKYDDLNDKELNTFEELNYQLYS